MFRSHSRGDLHTGSAALLGWPSTLSLRLMRLFSWTVRASTVQRCWAAYALHGRQASALATTSAVLGRPPSDRANARKSPISAAGKASGSRRTRMAIYCAVHSPIPRIERSLAIASSKVWLGLKKFGFAEAAAATDDSVCARAAGIPSKLACAILSGVGNMCVRPSPQTVCNGSPCSATSFAARFTAATTVIC